MKTAIKHGEKTLALLDNPGPWKAGETFDLDGAAFFIESVNVHRYFASGAPAETVVSVMPVDDVMFGSY